MLIKEINEKAIMTGSNDTNNQPQETNKDFAMKEISLLKEKMELIENRCGVLESYVKQLREHQLSRESPAKMMVLPNSLATVNTSLSSASRQQQNLQRPHEHLPRSIVASVPSARSPPPKYSEQIPQSTASHGAQPPVLRPSSRRNRKKRWNQRGGNELFRFQTHNGDWHIFHGRGGRGPKHIHIFNSFY